MSTPSASGVAGSPLRAWPGLRTGRAAGGDVRSRRCRSPRSRRWRAPCPPRPVQPLSRWSSAELATEAVTRGLAETISAATVRRWLAADAIKPWQHRSWIFPRDPDFGIKAARVLDLYARQLAGPTTGSRRLRDQCR